MPCLWGVDVLELDLAVTKDDRIVISHDPYIDPQICLDQNGEKLPAAHHDSRSYIGTGKTYDCGTLKNPRFPNQTPSRRKKFLRLKSSSQWSLNLSFQQQKTVEFNIETKFSSRPELSPPPKKFAQLVLTILKNLKWKSEQFCSRLTIEL